MTLSDALAMLSKRERGLIAVNPTSRGRQIAALFDLKTDALEGRPPPRARTAARSAGG